MKIIVPCAGPAPDQRTADYVINIAKRLNAQLIVLRMNAKTSKRTDIPVLLIPKWVRGAGDRRRMAEREPELNSEKAIITDGKDDR